MEGAEELRRQIAAAAALLEQEDCRHEELQRAQDEATQRQQLRRELDSIMRKVGERRKQNRLVDVHNELIDDDEYGPFAPDDTAHLMHKDDKPDPKFPIGEVINCTGSVSSGEFLWKIEGMSWLINALNSIAVKANRVRSCLFRIGAHDFALEYYPEDKTEIPGSVVIHHASSDLITFRYKMFIKRKNGGFEQWGGTGNVCCEDNDRFGPDLQPNTSIQAKGIFGLSHNELLTSEWVESDTLTIKVELQVMDLNTDLYDYDKQVYQKDINVPAPTLGADLASWLDSGKTTDVTFHVEGVPIKAHAAILCARSEVFEKLLSGSMIESQTREVTLDDCSALAFKALLKFLYSDDLSVVEAVLVNGEAGEPAASGDDKNAGGPRPSSDQWLAFLQDLLAASHKYQVCRLRLWCERELCKRIGLQEVCSILCQAHLYDATKLEQACLNFIKENFARVVTTAGFGSLGKDWPQVMLKINLFMAGVAHENAQAALQAQAGASVGCKRRRLE